MLGAKQRHIGDACSCMLIDTSLKCQRWTPDSHDPENKQITDAGQYSRTSCKSQHSGLEVLTWAQR